MLHGPAHKQALKIDLTEHSLSSIYKCGLFYMYIGSCPSVLPPIPCTPQSHPSVCSMPVCCDLHVHTGTTRLHVLSQECLRFATARGDGKGGRNRPPLPPLPCEHCP